MSLKQFLKLMEDNMKYLEISRMQANSILKCDGAISIGIYRGVYGQEYIQEVRVENESLDDAETRIMTELPDNLHYAFKYFEIWAGNDE